MQRVGFQIEMLVLRVEQHSVLRLVIDLDLRMIGPHVALTAGLGHAGQRNGRRVAGIANCAGADRAVVVWLTDFVTFKAALGNRRRALLCDERVGRTLNGGGMEFLGGRDLFRREINSATDRRPAWGGVRTL
jgi:hypothetical protein